MASHDMDMVGNVLPQVFNENASEDKGELARMQSFVGAIAVADLVKTTLGPKGMDKILQSVGDPTAKRSITVTNDGATILKSIHVDNPAAKILIDISKCQDEEVGDGTTTVAVLAGELIREAEKLVNQKIHPQIIIQGWRLARDVALKTLRDSAMDNSGDEEAFRRDLKNIAMTTLSSKLLLEDREHFSNLAVDAVLRLKGSGNLDYIKLIKKNGGTLKDSFLAEGFILEKSISTGCPRRKEKPRILIANTPMDQDKIKIFGSKVKVDSMLKVAEIEEAEKMKMKKKVEQILALKPDVFINPSTHLYYPEQLLAEKRIMVIDMPDFDGLERLAAVLGAEILSTFNSTGFSETQQPKLGSCQVIEELMIGEDKVICFKGCAANEACSIVLRGSGSHILDEAERSIHDAICVLVSAVKSHRVLYGGGNSEIRMSLAVEELAKSVRGKQALAIQSYAHALKQLPTIISDNAGYDSAEIVQNLRSEIYNGNTEAGLNMFKGEVDNMRELGVTECLRVKEQALLSASEAAELILRVDEIIRCAPRKREGQ
uniref:CCT-beta n=1 Tax=Sterkiella nova TaxID=200597 RepID=Q9U4E0_STENO|nr:chaperonin beta subunit [Sterkiella nova]